MKILIAIESCKADRHRHQAMIDTWLADLADTIDFKFFIGGINEPEEGEVWVPCLDTYEGLATKTKGICRWATAQGYDFLFKCDTDTVVHPGRLLASGYHQYDYMGAENADNLPASLKDFGQRISFASGGAGYWLSQDAMEIVSEGCATPFTAEDVYVSAMLGSACISPVWHEGYRWRPGSKIEGATTFHLSSALQVKYRSELMHEYYQKILDK